MALLERKYERKGQPELCSLFMALLYLRKSPDLSGLEMLSVMLKGINFKNPPDNGDAVLRLLTENIIHAHQSGSRSSVNVVVSSVESTPALLMAAANAETQQPQVIRTLPSPFLVFIFASSFLSCHLIGDT